MSPHSLSAWDRVLLARHSARPRSSDYIGGALDHFAELRGDRLFADDRALIGGMGQIGDQQFVFLGQEKGTDTPTRLLRNFGMMHPEGYRKAHRLMKMAEKFNKPLVCLIDTPGAHPGLQAEERGQGWAIAQNLKAMALLRVPILAIIIGEGCSGGALGIGVADVMGMLENSYYSVISPEGCAEILWRDGGAKKRAAEKLQLTADLQKRLKMIDQVLREPEGGAHCDPAAMIKAVRTFITTQLTRLLSKSADELVQTRYQRYRAMGQLAPSSSLSNPPFGNPAHIASA